MGKSLAGYEQNFRDCPALQNLLIPYNGRVRGKIYQTASRLFGIDLLDGRVSPLELVEWIALVGENRGREGA